ncbi:MAG: laminin B domain-containing protein [Pirellulales bacterium]
MNLSLRPILTAVLGCLAVAACASAVLAASSTFDTGTDGWKVVGLGSGYPLPAYGGVDPSWNESGGNPGGAVFAGDQYAETFFSAPTEFLGNQSARLGNTLGYDLLISYTDNAAYPAVILAGTDRGLYYVGPIPVLNDWYRFTVPLTATQWKLNNWKGPAATESDMQAVLADLKGLYVNAEWHTGADATYLDNFTMAFVPGDADTNDRVDIFDVAIVQTKYGTTSGAAWADGNFDGNGTVDIFDVAMMQVNYGYGVASSPSPVPEPSTLVLGGLGAMLLLAWRNHRLTRSHRRRRI